MYLYWNINYINVTMELKSNIKKENKDNPNWLEWRDQARKSKRVTRKKNIIDGILTPDVSRRKFWSLGSKLSNQIIKLITTLFFLYSYSTPVQ